MYNTFFWRFERQKRSEGDKCKDTSVVFFVLLGKVIMLSYKYWTLIQKYISDRIHHLILIIFI